MKKLGFGLMRLPLTVANDFSKIDIEQTNKMVDLFIEKGFTYFDTAWMYHDFKGEAAVKEILTSRYSRTSYQLATKLHVDFTESLEDIEKVFETQLKNCGVDYFDYYLIHDLNGRIFEKAKRLGAFEWVKEKKAQGLVKHIGISFHDEADLLDEIINYFPETEFVQLQINYLDWDSEGIQSRKCYEVARKYGKEVIIMEPVKGGTLATVPEEAEKLLKSIHPDWSIPSWAIRFTASLDGVMMILSGMSNLSQLDENTSVMDGVEPLNDVEMDAIRQTVSIFSRRTIIPCTSCAYCTSVCPKGIPIPKYFELYNVDNQELETKRFTSQTEYYGNLIEIFPKASDCSKCGECENLCPQHLKIRDYLCDVADYFEKQ